VANPFGPRAGVAGRTVKVTKGEALRLRFRVLLHAGEKAPDVGAFAKGKNGL
jgi:hypothetical protein